VAIQKAVILDQKRRQLTTRRVFLALQLVLCSRHFVLRHRLVQSLASWRQIAFYRAELHRKEVYILTSKQNRALARMLQVFPLFYFCFR
jgi:hypothetical protein